MTDSSYWEPFFTNNKYPCYVRELENEKIMYANAEFFRVFQCDEGVIGKKFHEIVMIDSDSYEHIHQCNLNHQDYQTNFFHKATNKHYTAFAHMVRDGKTVFCEFRIMVGQEEKSEFESALTRCIEIYQLPTEEVIPNFMELLCQYYDCNRAYVHRLDYEHNSIQCISQWNVDNSTKTYVDLASKEDGKNLIDWIMSSTDHGVVMADFQDETIKPAIRNFFHALNIQNLVLCPVEDMKKQVVGVVGISNLKYPKDDLDKRLLTTISRFVAQDVAHGFLEAKLFQLHHRDSLTGLYNRTGYAKRVDMILSTNPKSLGIISANANGLKFVNEQMGITGGDAFVQKIAQKIKQHFGFEIFRMSGDEFLGIAPNISQQDFETTVAQLHEEMKEKDNYDFSLGQAWGSGSIDITKLTFEAETVMYINKQEYYAKTDRKFDSVNDSVLADLLSSLENEEFMIYLQPQVRLKDASLHGAEALIRRFDKVNKKMVFPDQFIPIYEKKSVIRHIDMFVVDAVCRLLQRWEKEHKSVPISVNLSRVTLQEYGIVESIVEICDKYQVPHELLVIEVTERVGLIENNVASSLITNFKKHGFSISLDDFGCAYSNIVTLAQIEVDEVKIDKSLVDDVLINKKNTIIVESVLSMCNKLDNTSTLAEGIEDEEQAKLLYELACGLGQGYYYSRPIPVSEFEVKYFQGSTP